MGVGESGSSSSVGLVISSSIDGTIGKCFFTLTSGGNIGIGNRTSSPDELLHVHTSSGEAKIHVEAATNARVRIRAHNGESIVQFADAASSNPGEINYTHSSDTMSFRTGGSVKAYIKSSGELWVGTNSGISNGGGKLRVVSTVSDKTPGDPGHPMQFDDGTYTINNVPNTVGGWYVGGVGVCVCVCVCVCGPESLCRPGTCCGRETNN